MPEDTPNPVEFEHFTLEDSQASQDFISAPNVIQTSKSMVVGAQNNFTELNPNYGIGLNKRAEAGATMVSMGQYYSFMYANGSSSSSPSIDWSKANVQSVAATGNLTFTLLNGKVGGRYILKILQDESGSRTYTWPATVAWSGGTSPTGSGAGKIDIVGLICDGGSYYASSVLNF